MAQQKAPSTPGEVIDAISRFLASPPEGTPDEIIEAFNAVGDRHLPPKLFLETVEQAPIAIAITDPSARILYVNYAFEQLTGYERNEVIGRNQSLLSSECTPLSVYQDLWRTIREQRVWQGSLINHRKNKQEYLAELIVSPLLNAKRQIAYYLGMHRDVTELHQLERRLKFQNSLIESALDALPIVVAIVAADRKVLLDNHAYKALLSDFRSADPASLFLEALAQQIGLDFETICAGGKGFTNVEIQLDPPGSTSPRWFACSGVRVAELDEAVHNYFKRPENARSSLLLIANEVTASRNRINEARLSMIRASMAEQQMVQTMREAISGSIFKLQAPLNVIKAALAMPESGAECSSLRRVLQQALANGDEAMDSLHAALPSPAVEQASQVNINELLHEVLRLSTDTLLATGVVVDWHPAPVLPTMVARANALRGLFKYLVDNAIKALNESTQDYRELRIATGLDAEEILIDVIDNGPGVPEAHRLKVFEPFFCGWTQFGGHAGMGLTMAQEVAFSHGGSVEMDADFYGGCRVTVRLPTNGTGGG